jgi:protein-tyrosine phosphatase
VLEDRARRLLGGEIEVRSAGTWASGGSPATPETVAAAADLGIDLSEHRSTRFTRDLAARADLIITMTAEQREEVRREAPEAADKTFTLKGLVRKAAVDPDVADPLGLDDNAYGEIAREIEGLIDDLIPSLEIDRAAVGES